MNFEDIKRATDPRKILEAYSGELGSIYGLTQGAFGLFGEFSPKTFFNMSDYYDTAGQFSVKDFYQPSDYFDAGR